MILPLTMAIFNNNTVETADSNWGFVTALYPHTCRFYSFPKMSIKFRFYWENQFGGIPWKQSSSITWLEEPHHLFPHLANEMRSKGTWLWCYEYLWMLLRVWSHQLEECTSTHISKSFLPCQLRLLLEPPMAPADSKASKALGRWKRVGRASPHLSCHSQPPIPGSQNGISTGVSLGLRMVVWLFLFILPFGSISGPSRLVL